MLPRPRRFVLSFVWIITLVSLLAACAPAAPPAAAPTQPAQAAPTSPPPKPAAKPAAPTEWVIGIAEEASSMDPPWLSALPNRAMQIHMLDAIVSLEDQDFKVVPMLAESWKQLDDRNWEFKIRRGVKFHNGDDLTAADVMYSYNLYRQEKSQNKTYLAEVANIEQVDQYTIKLTTRGPSPGLLANLSYLLIMPQQAREKAGEEGFGKNPIGTGPYKFVEFLRGQRLVMEANPNYWRGPVNPKKLTFRPIADPSTRVAELKTGGIHVIISPPPARFKEIDSGDTQLVPLKAGRLMMYQFNTKEKPFDDVRVRQAANYAVDRESILKNVLEGYGELLHGPFASPWMGYDPDLKPYAYDPAKAKQLLADAGYPNGFETTWSISQGIFLKDREIAEAVASQLAQVGIKVQLVPTDRAKLISDWQDGLFKGFTSTAWGTTGDPDTMIGFSFYQKKARKPDDKLSEIIDRSRREANPEQRKKILQEMGRYVHDQALWLFVHAQSEFYAKRKDVPWEPYALANSYAFTAYYQVPKK